MSARGIKKEGAVTVTTALRGEFATDLKAQMKLMMGSKWKGMNQDESK